LRKTAPTENRYGIATQSKTRLGAVKHGQFSRLHLEKLIRRGEELMGLKRGKHGLGNACVLRAVHRRDTVHNKKRGGENH